MKPITDRTLIVVSPEHLSTEAEGEATILHLKTGMYYGLDGAGAALWELLRKPRTLSELVEGLVQQYDVDSAECRSDLVELLERLAGEGLIELRHASTA